MTSLRKNSKKSVFVSSAAALSNLKNVNLGDAVSTYLTRSIVAFKDIFCASKRLKIYSSDLAL